jgi:hypothetical protein
LLKPQTRQQRRHPNRGADSFDDGYAELLLQPIRLDVHGALADAHGNNHFGIKAYEPLRLSDKIIHDDEGNANHKSPRF